MALMATPIRSSSKGGGRFATLERTMSLSKPPTRAFCVRAMLDRWLFLEKEGVLFTSFMSRLRIEM